MPDLNHVIDAHTSQMRGWWRDPEYIRERKAFVKRRPACDRCGRPATTPGHSHEDYRDFETYLNAVKTDKCDALCSACNKAERAQRRPCPSCCEKYKRDPTSKKGRMVVGDGWIKSSEPFIVYVSLFWN